MKTFLHLRILALLVAGLMAVSPRAGAQFALSVTSSLSSILVANPVTFTINVTNLTGFLLDVVVTDALPASVQILNVTTNIGGTYTTNGSVVAFDLGSLGFGGAAQLSVTAQPTVAGFITNTVTVASAYTTNTASTNVVVQVTNAVVPQADLGVAITGPAQAVITND